jgi:hypothetical protein
LPQFDPPVYSDRHVKAGTRVTRVCINMEMCRCHAQERKQYPACPAA